MLLNFRGLDCHLNIKVIYTAFIYLFYLYSHLWIFPEYLFGQNEWSGLERFHIYHKRRKSSKIAKSLITYLQPLTFGQSSFTWSADDFMWFYVWKLHRIQREYKDLTYKRFNIKESLTPATLLCMKRNTV